MKNKKPRREIILIKNIPSGTKIFFKSYCARQGMSMTKFLIQVMEKYARIEKRHYGQSPQEKSDEALF